MVHVLKLVLAIMLIKIWKKPISYKKEGFQYMDLECGK